MLTFRNINKINAFSYLNRYYCNNNINNVITRELSDDEISLSENQKKLLNNIKTLQDKYQHVFTTEEKKRLNSYEHDCYMNESLSDFNIGLFYSQGIIKNDSGKESLDQLSTEYFKRSADKDLAEGQYAYAMSLLMDSTRNIFVPILPSLSSVVNRDDGQSDSMVIGNGWVSSENVDKDFDYKSWLRQERMKSLRMKDNIVQHEQEKQKKKMDAIRYLNLSSIQEYPNAQFTLGMILLHGKYDIKVNRKQGLYWLEKAREKDYLVATYELGKYHHAQYSMIQATTDEEQDKSFIKYFIEASQKGHADSSYWLATNLMSSSQPEKSIEYLETSVQQGSGQAATFLSMLYRNGIYVEQDSQKFMKYLQLAIERKDAVALLTMGELYFNGQEGLQQNYKLAFQYFSESSQLGNSDAYLNQGVMYFNGYGVEQSYLNAFYSYQNSFHHNMNNKAAITNLYTMHSEGLGVPKSPELAQFYKNLLSNLPDDESTDVD
ncbi:hypothetical protein DLAC_01625 [Tieghemostelium lacteum]|uniref:Sel1 repeat family protein n=1 Tax=Tieghemostelium lacteum TaxID=361077 RepID=A0A152A687_TIELA|nr:hypothetical protein DLAC_01625 [Tieghemostelium lacteum]|eukprot:KYR01625.1 hypothetical protein DLAC_01625 [Tieghemostelium lacteum]